MLRTIFILILIFFTLLVPNGSAQEYVTTPEGKQVKLQTRLYGPPYASPRTSDVPLQQIQFYAGDSGEKVLHGVSWLKFVSGEYKEVTTYSHGVKNGRFARWYDRGPKEVEGKYRDGLLDGAIAWYYASGKPQRVENYRGGELDGPYTLYFETGGIKEQGAFRHDVKEGSFVQYHENGEKAAEGTFHSGFVVGELILFDAAGVVTGKGNVDHDLVVGPWQCFSPDGAPAQRRENCDSKFYLECTCR